MLRVPPTEVLRPESLNEALRALAAPTPPKVLAGGTDLLVSLKYGHHRGRPLLSLGRLPLHGISEEEEAWTIGAGTPVADLAGWAAGGVLEAMGEAARLVAAPPIQTRATLGGNLCLDTRCVFFNQSAFWRSGRPVCRKAGGDVCHVVPGSPRCHACHQADLPPALLVLGAEVEVANEEGTRTFPLADLYSGEGKEPLRLAVSELLTRVRVRRPAPGAGAAYEKLRPRKGLDFPAAAAAAYVELAQDGSCRAARVALGAVDSRPLLVPAAAQALVGRTLTEGALEEAAASARGAARPVKNADLTPGYRKKVIGTLVARAVRRAWTRAESGRESA